MASTMINYLEDFLLNSGPKQDCLVRICKYISAYDMVNLSESSKHFDLFVEFLKDRVVDSSSFDLGEILSKPEETELFQKVFVHFGSDMQKINVSLSIGTFDMFIQNIMQHCVPGNLTELEMGMDLGRYDHFRNSIDRGLLGQIRPILSCLEKLSLINNCNLWEPIFRIFRRDLTQLKTLKLKRFKFYDNWMKVFPNELSNVTELYLIKVGGLTESVDGFELFLNQFTNLQVFVHLRNNGDNLQPEVIADCLYRRFPQLKGIGCNVDDKRHQSTFTVGNRFNFLEKFTNLTEIHVACYDDCPPRDIHSIIQFVPNMKILSIMEMYLFQPPVAIRYITRSIKEIIDRRSNRFPRNDRVNVIVREDHHRDFMVLKDINQVIRFTVKPKYAV